MRTRSSRRPAAAYLLLQGSAVTAWWILLLAVPETRARFRPADAPDTMLLAFWLPDLLLVALGSLAGGVLLLRAPARAASLLWLVAGATAYATLYCIALLLLAPQTWPAATAMVPAAAVTLAIAWMHPCRSDRSP
ncbi:MAG: hypothetical protein ACYTJ0_15255 [Planctomycetota bacterium]